jgi:DNA-binding FadR family transcriptional regulator
VSIDVRAPAYRVLADDLRAQITSGRLRPGDRLPTEPQLCRDCGVSRSTVREALRLLASQHLIVTTRGVSGGSFVAHPSPEQLSATLATGVRLMQLSSTVESGHLLDVRAMVEDGTVRKASLRHKPEHLEAIRETLFDPWHDDLERMVILHPQFHRAIVTACENPVLELISAPLHGISNIRNLVAHLGRDFWIRVDADHRSILDSIEARDPDRAAAACARHLNHLRETFAPETLGADML